MSRARLIHDELERHFTDETHIATAALGADVWREITTDDDREARFGWLWPVGHSGPPMIVRFCPEIIAEQTAHLNDVDLGEYLDFIEWVCDTHVSLWDDEPNPDTRQQITIDELVEVFPGSLEVWFRMQLAVLCT